MDKGTIRPIFATHNYKNCLTYLFVKKIKTDFVGGGGGGELAKIGIDFQHCLLHYNVNPKYVHVWCQFG